MASGPSKATLRQIRTLFHLGTVGALDDAELLARFVDRRGAGDGAAEHAFEALVERHGPMVLGVCRRVLADPHDAEDAFQATFLVLVRKARSIARREQLGPWLYGVASRTAREARARASRRRVKERQVIDAPRPETAGEEERGDLRAVLDVELARLPARYRAAVVLCDLEGRSRKEAARQLGLPEGTLSSRLARARTMLRARLTRRGLALSAGALAMALSRETTAAPVPAALMQSTVRSAMRFAAGHAAAGVASTSVASLTERVLNVMLMNNLKLIVPAVLAVVVAAAGTAVQAQRAEPERAPEARREDQDRLKGLEQKLDRLIQVLESRPVGLPPATVPMEPPGRRANNRSPNLALPSAADPEITPGKPFSVTVTRPDGREEPVTRSIRMTRSHDGRPATIEQRLDAVEQRLDAVVARLGRLEGERGRSQRREGDGNGTTRAPSTSENRRDTGVLPPTAAPLELPTSGNRIPSPSVN